MTKDFWFAKENKVWIIQISKIFKVEIVSLKPFNVPCQRFKLNLFELVRSFRIRFVCNIWKRFRRIWLFRLFRF